MNVQGLYAALNVKDIDAVERFYTALLGRAPDDRPMDGLVQWRQGFFGVQLFADKEKSGNGLMTIVTPDLDDTRAQLASRGLTLEPTFEGDFGRIAQISDPEGNRVNLAEPPRG